MISTQSQPIALQLDAIPRIRCGVYPTPLEEMTRLRENLGPKCPRLFVKRDDFTGTGFGSNKLRKLDYAIASEIDRGTTTIVTIAGECSNHARVTAAVCARLGLRCVLVLNKADSDSIPAGMIPASRYVYETFGAKVHWVASRNERERTALALVDEMLASDEKAAYLPLGVSFPLGAIGFVQAVREIDEQFRPVGTFPSHIFHASTSGGTQAGMIAGCRLFGHTNTQIVGVSPDDPSDEVAKRVASIIGGMPAHLETSNLDITSDEIMVLDEFIGSGYGKETPESIYAASMAARTEAIILDHTYTAKTFAALLSWIDEGRFTASDNVLFWHTGGQLGGFYAPANGSQQQVA